MVLHRVLYAILHRVYLLNKKIRFLYSGILEKSLKRNRQQYFWRSETELSVSCLLMSRCIQFEKWDISYIFRAFKLINLFVVGLIYIRLNNILVGEI